tara:strand:+ start:2135 stop:2818 length:684 start_codon:yes stop_codon:yes gene_type:complete
MPQGKGTYGSKNREKIETIMRNYRSNTNRLANLKSNPVVKAAIQRDKDTKTTKRNTAIIAAGLSLLIPGGFFKGIAGIGRKAIGQAFRKAGTSGLNLKSADTVGSRIKQAQAIDPKLAKADWARFGQQFGKGQPVYNQQGIIVGKGGTTSLLGMGKGGRTLQRAVEQGPAKFFSKPRQPKTGVRPAKRTDAKIRKKLGIQEKWMIQRLIDKKADVWKKQSMGKKYNL